MENTDNQQVMSKRDAALERLRKRHPDTEYADDEAIFGQISDDYDDYDKELSSYKANEEALGDMMSRDPRSAHFLSNWRDGADPVVELVRQFGTDIKDAIDDPERLEQIAEANKEFVERVAKEKELADTYESNLEESLQALDTFQSERGLSDDEVDDIMEYLVTIVKDGVMGRFTSESFDMAQKALNHDVDVEQADMEGEVRGRNAKIDEKLRKSSKGDGVPMLAGKNGQAPDTTQRSIFDVARGAS